MLCPTLFLATLALVSSDVSHLLESTTPEPPPKPYAFSYTAGRYPGHADRMHTEVSDGSGVVKGIHGTGLIDTATKGTVAGSSLYALLKQHNQVFTSSSMRVKLADGSAPMRQMLSTTLEVNIKGSFSYVDPLQKVRTVDYVADKEGFHPILSDVPPEHPSDSASVAQAKDRHYQLYAKIAEEHANPHPELISSPHETEAVAAARVKHAELFRVIAEQHARIAAEREVLLREEEEKQQLQELGQ